ncbi:CMGC protein kinase [Mollisia scopiformis]|uniref:non-specific serine/threonine protein kinase n=1 Tax=Mollisia scopiformis TaxID=149040 RepID=A0A132B249_MOLSC|nr:CMGC protein kinase [Mollisia scopiformis]KUJ06460.1 CMGC protein kinase [Mollisia scopiformis]
MLLRHLRSYVLLEEERLPGYNYKNFYPVNPGDVFNKRYKMISKLGWGTSSTVWLAQDNTRRALWESKRYVAVKVGVCGHMDEDAATHERNLSRYLGANPSHFGFNFVRVVQDSFKLAGPYGSHTCLVYEPMREPLNIFQRRFADGKVSPAALQVFIQLLLEALDYLHSECEIIHTDLKMDNILMSFENPSVLEEYVNQQAANPMPRKVIDGRTIYLSHNDFGLLQSFRLLPKITDLGLAQPGDTWETLRFPIQPPMYHAPENLGVLVWNMMEGKDLFQNFRTDQGDYDTRRHLGEMIALLGPPPKELLDRERAWGSVKWDGVLGRDGKPCPTARQYFGGPFLMMVFLYEDLIPKNVTLEGTVAAFQGDEKQLFLNFVKNMLQWVPEHRKSAKELLQDPWLGLPTGG